MLSAVDAAVVSPAPLVTVRSAVIGEAEAVRAVVRRVQPRVVYQVRFQLSAGATGGSGCVSSAAIRIRTGSAPSLRVALAPRRLWCTGAGVLRVVAIRRGAVAGRVRLHVRPPLALGRGDVVGRLLLGPTCPVERADDPCDPVARPSPVGLVALDTSGAVAARTVTLGDGSFALDLPAGRYTLRAEHSAALPRIGDTSVLVTDRATRSHPQRVIVTGDTGIR
jgi:hypothetical protein